MNAEPRRMPAEGSDQHVRTTPIMQARPSQVTVELAPLEKVGVRELALRPP